MSSWIYLWYSTISSQVLILLTSFLPEVGAAGEASEQFLQLYQSKFTCKSSIYIIKYIELSDKQYIYLFYFLGLASEAPWKQFLALRGVLQQIADLMTKEIEQLHRLEETTLTSDLAQGNILCPLLFFYFFHLHMQQLQVLRAFMRCRGEVLWCLFL